MPIISLLFDQGPASAALDCATVAVWAVLAQLKLGGRRAQSLIVTIGLLTTSALIVHVSDGKPESYFHFFVMVAALSLYEDWVPFGAAVAFVLLQQGITAAIVDYDRAESPWLWALIHSRVHRRAERGPARDLAGQRAQPRGVPVARRVARGGGGDGRRGRAAGRGQPERAADPRHGPGPHPG